MTGASSGIGLELAKQFAASDFDLVVAAEDAELASGAAELEGLGAQVDAVQVDLATPNGVEELSDTGVTVTVLMPGPTETEFFERADMEDTPMGGSPSMQDDAEQVARQAFEGLMAGEERVEAGSLMSKLQGRESRFIPNAVRAKAHSKMAEPGAKS